MVLISNFKYYKSSNKVINMIPLPTPTPVARAMHKLGRDISLARRRRRMSQKSLAERIGASLMTVRRLEKGDSKIALHFVVRTLYLFGLLERFNGLADVGMDDVGLAMANEQMPKRIRASKTDGVPGAV